MGFLLRAFGILVSGIAIVSLVRYLGGITLTGLGLPLVMTYDRVVAEFLFMPELALRDMAWFSLDLTEKMFAAFLVVLVMGPATWRLWSIDGEFADGGFFTPLIARLSLALVLAWMCGGLAGISPTIVSVIVFAGLSAGLVVWFAFRAVAGRTARQRAMGGFFIGNVAFFMAVALGIYLVDRFV